MLKYNIKNDLHRRLRPVAIYSAMLLGLALPGQSSAEPPAGDSLKAPATQSAMAGCPAKNPIVIEGLESDGRLKLMINKSAVLHTAAPYKRISVGQAEVADVNTIGPANILVTAKRQGTTQLIIWNDADEAQVVDVTVGLDMQSLQQQIGAMFPDAKIEITGVNGAVALRGRVPSVQVADQVVQLATPYAAPAKVLNFLEVAGGRQVLLKVRFAEVSRSALNNLGVNWGMTDGVSMFGSNVGQVSPLGISDTGGLNIASPSSSVTMFGKGQAGNTTFAYFVNALRENNLLRVLAEPNLIAISGQEASFLAGGEFPIPVTQSSGSGSGGNSITVEYREFGVKLNFIPVVLGDGKIRLKVSPEVSDLDFTTAVRFNGFVIPGLSTRKVTTTIELGDGQSFAIAGLLNNSVSATKDVTPLLGDMPVIGSLFRSVRYQKKETELVVLVTPQVIDALNPGQVPTLPGEKWRDPTEADLFLNQDIGGEIVSGDNVSRPQFKGESGFVPAATPGKPQK